MTDETSPVSCPVTSVEALEFHRQVLAALAAEGPDGPIRRDALAIVALWEAEGSARADDVERWRHLLSLSADEMAPEVLREDGWGAALRQATPFGEFASLMVAARQVMDEDREALAALAKL